MITTSLSSSPESGAGGGGGDDQQQTPITNQQQPVLSPPLNTTTSTNTNNTTNNNNNTTKLHRSFEQITILNNSYNNNNNTNNTFSSNGSGSLKHTSLIHSTDVGEIGGRGGGGGDDSEEYLVRSHLSTNSYYDSGDEDNDPTSSLINKKDNSGGGGGGGGDNSNSISNTIISRLSPLRNHLLHNNQHHHNSHHPLSHSEPSKPSLPFTFHRAASVVLLVVIFLILITCYYIEYRFVDQSTTAYYLFLVTRPLPLVPLLLIIPLYGINSNKTIRYSIFIALALASNIISDCIYSVDISINSNGHNENSQGEAETTPQVVYYLSFSFLLLSRLFYTTAFIIGIGKSIKIRLFHAIPFYAYAATLVLMIFFSSTIAPIIVPPTFQALPPTSSNTIVSFNGSGSGSGSYSMSSSSSNNYVNNNNNNNNFLPTFSTLLYNFKMKQDYELINSNNNNNMGDGEYFYDDDNSNNNNNIDNDNNNLNNENGGSYSYIQTSSDSTVPQIFSLDAPHFSLIVLYSIIEATILWRALALTSTFPGTNPTRMLLPFCVLGSTCFGVTDTLIVINNYYYPLDGIFYYSTGGIWLAHALIVFSIPRRMEVRDYIYKYINPFSQSKVEKADLSTSLSASPYFSLSKR